MTFLGFSFVGCLQNLKMLNLELNEKGSNWGNGSVLGGVVRVKERERGVGLKEEFGMVKCKYHYF